MATKKNDLISKTRMAVKAQAMCEAKYREACEYGQLGLEDTEKRTISEWCAMADSFAELFDCNRDFFLGVSEDCPF